MPTNRDKVYVCNFLLAPSLPLCNPISACFRMPTSCLISDHLASQSSCNQLTKMSFFTVVYRRVKEFWYKSLSSQELQLLVGLEAPINSKHVILSMGKEWFLQDFVLLLSLTEITRDYHCRQSNIL